jgi:hypothetical protein
MQNEIERFNEIEFNHAVTHIEKNGFASKNFDALVLNVETDEQFEEYLRDLIDYGLTRHTVEYGDLDDFKLWQSYRIEQVQLKLCKDPGYTMKGTYIYDKNVYIFASIKKDAGTQEHLNYKDKFLEAGVFQWECEAGLSTAKKQELIDSEKAFLFIRKVESENGIVLPFTYVGTGRLKNPQKSDNPRDTLLFDIHMENELPDDLQYDFGLLSQQAKDFKVLL